MADEGHDVVVDIEHVPAPDWGRRARPTRYARR
jgi:hypothetical protein